MPAQGIVTVGVSPWQANFIVWWLESAVRDQRRNDDAPLGIIAEALWKHRDQHNIESLAAKFRKVASRQRRAGPFKPVDVQITRGDAAWLAQKVKRRGMFGRGFQAQLPPEVQMLANLCAQKIRKQRGRPALKSAKLDAAIVSQVRKYHDGSILEQRRLKRLRRRQRQEAAAQESASNYKGILAKKLMEALKST